MDFHSLLRKDLQFLCKKNKIPANITNVAMADALKSLEIVEGLDEYTSQSNAKAPHSSPTLAKTATRTTRRKTTIKAPATSCSTKKDESVYTTRRSTRLLQKCMADLSLKAKETLDNKPAQDKNSEETSEDAQVTPGGDVSASLEKEWETLKNNSHQEIGDLGDITVVETNKDEKETANSLVQEETFQAMCEEGSEKNEVMSNEKDKQEEETLQAACEKDSKKNENDQDISVLEHANTETSSDNKEFKNVLDQQEKQKEETIQENVSEPDQTVSDAGDSDTELEEDASDVEGSSAAPPSPPLLEKAKLKTTPLFPPFAGDNPVLEHANNDKKDSMDVLDQQEVEETIQENDSELDKINTYDQDTNGGDSETERDEDNSDNDSEDTMSEADSNQAVMGSEIADEEIIISGAPTSPPNLVEDNAKPTPVSSPFAAGSISIQFPRPSISTTTPSKKSALKVVSVEDENKENNMELMMNVNDGMSKGEAKKKKKKKVENLKDVSMRQLVKMVKELSIKSSNRTALQILPGNNQIAE